MKRSFDRIAAPPAARLLAVGIIGACGAVFVSPAAGDGGVGMLLDAQPAYQGSCWTLELARATASTTTPWASVPVPVGRFGRHAVPPVPVPTLPLSCPPPSEEGGGGTAGVTFPSNGVQLLAWLPVTQFGSQNTSANTVEGYVSPSGREYAIIGLSHGTGFVEVTDPGNPNIVAFISSSPAASSLWRDVRVYQSYCYTVSEAGGGIQVINMSQIDSGVVSVVGNVTTGGSATTHTVFVNQDSGYLYRCGGGSTLGLRIYSLANPASPTYVTTALTGRYIHECQVVNYTSGPYAGKEIAFCFTNSTSSGGSPGVDIVDVTNKTSIPASTLITYPNSRFSHQGWLSPDKRYLYLDDELDEQQLGLQTLTRVFDVSNLASPVFVTTFGNGGGAVDHNQYTRGNLILQSNYRSGLRVFDATNPTAPVEVAYFDTYPSDNNPNFNGLWDNYPYLPSGIVLGSDIEKGLFVWRIGADALNFSFPNGRPTLISPAGQNVLVSITNQSGAMQPGTAKLNYSVNGGASYTSVNLAPAPPQGGNNYYAPFPAIACGTVVKYYISAMTTSGMTVQSPNGAPSFVYEATAATGIQIGFDDKLETNLGWVVGAPGDNATTGIWVRVDPVGTAAQPEDDHTPAPGVLCFVTGQGAVGGAIGDADVDGGSTTLTSPTFDATVGGSGAQVYIEYYRWYSNNQGSAPNEDSMPVSISNNNGSTWVQLELVTENAGAWVGKSFKISDFVTPTNQMKLRFVARDLGSGSIVEAGVDDVRVVAYQCAPPSVPGDVTGNGYVNIDDLFAVINAWGACPAPPASCPADIAPPGPPPGNGFVNIDDLFMVINNWS